MRLPVSALGLPLSLVGMRVLGPRVGVCCWSGLRPVCDQAGRLPEVLGTALGREPRLDGTALTLSPFPALLPAPVALSRCSLPEEGPVV